MTKKKWVKWFLTPELIIYLLLSKGVIKIIIKIKLLKKIK